MMKMLVVLITILTLLTTPSFADNSNPEPQTSGAPLPFGIGIDLYQMEQPYSISSLTFSLPGLTLPVVNTNEIAVDNKIKHADIKLDAWILPYMNLFAILGKVDGETQVDLSGARLPLPIANLAFDYDGLVYGVGTTLAVANEKFFGTLTATYTKTDLKGDFNSTLSALSVQPRVGLHTQKYQLWVGGHYLDADEEHNGSITLPTLGSADFDVTLENDAKWTPVIGGTYHFNKMFLFTLEAGFGERESVLANLTYRF